MELTISGRRLAYDDQGQGVPFVLLHAFPFDRRFWKEVAGRLTTRARLIIPDLRGFGESAQGGAYSIADLADDVAALLDHLKIERAVLGGVSMGGYVSLAFAARHGHRLLGLVLADTKAGPDSPEARVGRNDAIALVQSKGADAFVEKQLSRWLSPAAPPSVIATTRTLGTQTPDAVIAGLEALRDRPDRVPDLAQITCPTLVLVGTDDTITPPTEAAVIATSISKAVLIELPGAGHLSNLETPAPFAQAVFGFLPRTN